MSNVMYGEELYNESVKNQYLSGMRSKTSILRIFKASLALEEFYKKDLFEFSREELSKLFFMLNPSKFNASYQNGINVSNYIDWAISNGYRKMINPLLSVERKWYHQFVNVGKIYFTDEELNYFISKCRNAQDAVIIKLRMEGVSGEASSELLNLKISDVNEKNNTLQLTDLDNNKRTLAVSEQCIALCLAAHRQTTYLKSNGAYKKETKSTITNLVDNEYILKSSITRTENFEDAEKHLIHRRLAVLSKYFEEPYLTPTNVSYSGMLAMAKDIYLHKGSLETEDYDRVLDVFNYKTTDEDGGQRFFRLREEFLNIEKVKELYKLK